MTPLANAIDFAVLVHELGAGRDYTQQLDKANAPYILHPLRVMDAAFRAGLGEDGMIVAVLHDVEEDSPGALEVADLFPGKQEDRIALVRAALDALTRRGGEPYFDYIARCKKNDLARRVKLLDLDDNGAAWRLDRLPTKQAASLAVRYGKARAMLLDAPQGDAP